jgi:anti-sigma factor RsiW
VSFHCEQLTAALSEQAAGELSQEATAALEAHLRECPACRTEAVQLRAFLSALQPAPLSEGELAMLEQLPGRVAKAWERRSPAKWRIPAVLVAAAAAAVFTLWTRPVRHAGSPRAAVERSAVERSADDGSSVPFADEGLFSLPDTDDTSGNDLAEADALMLEGPGLFGHLDG